MGHTENRQKPVQTEVENVYEKRNVHIEVRNIHDRCDFSYSVSYQYFN